MSPSLCPQRSDSTHSNFQDVTSGIEAAIKSDSEDDVDESAIEEGDSDDDDWEDDDNEESEAAIKSDSEDDVDESAIEEEDDNKESGPPSVAEHRPMFQRVDSKPDFASGPSLLTMALRQNDRASVLQNAASQSSPAIRRSRKTTPNGPSTGASPQEDSGLMMSLQSSRSKPIIMTTSGVQPPAMCPKTIRRTMLATELSGSLRQNLLWERQQKNATVNAVVERQQSAVNLLALRRAMTTGDVKGLNTNEQQAQIRSTTFSDDNKPSSTYNQFFNSGLGDYHKTGW